MTSIPSLATLQVFVRVIEGQANSDPSSFAAEEAGGGDKDRDGEAVRSQDGKDKNQFLRFMQPQLAEVKYSEQLSLCAKLPTANTSFCIGASSTDVYGEDLGGGMADCYGVLRAEDLIVLFLCYGFPLFVSLLLLVVGS